MRVHPGGCCRGVCRVSAYQRANWRASRRQRPRARALGNREASSVANVRSTECMDGVLCTTLSVVPRAKSEEPDLHCIVYRKPWHYCGTQHRLTQEEEF